jgi:gliding motility-associated-like protein
VKRKLHYLLFLILFGSFCSVFGQNVTLYNQFNGRYDFTFVGNTMNVAENVANDPCLILTSSSETLTLASTDVVTAAYLYWAGSGTGDFNVKLNGQDIVAERQFAHIQPSSGKPFFSAFTNVTSQVQSTGNGNYTLSDLDITSFLNATDYCNNGTNFAGWALVVIYENASFPLNQLNVYDGLQSIPISTQNPPELSLSITLNSLNVIDNANAKIGFVAWEGDRNIQVTESLYVNDNLIGNPPLNPSNNAFNGTNSFTGANDMFNMDLDVYNIQNNISIGDTSATIKLTSGQDYVMINSIVTKLNSQLPDATIVIDNVIQECNSRTITVEYTVSNFNSTNELLSGTPIAIYINGIFIQYDETTLPIPIDGSYSGTITLVIPDTIPNDFELLFVVDDIGNGTGITTELSEINNTFSQLFSFWLPPNVTPLEPIVSCNEGLTKGTFDFGNYDELVLANSNQTFGGFYETLFDAENQVNQIINTTNYVATTTPKEIFIRVQDENCYTITSFLLNTKNCPPTVYNYVSANNDSYNDVFFVKGLRDIFVNFKIEIYNRWGRLVWTGNNNSPDWDGFSNENFRLDTNISPKSTFYYVIDLNDSGYPEPLVGWLYLTK